MYQEIISSCDIICHHGTIFMIEIKSVYTDLIFFFKLGGIFLFLSFTVSTSCIESSWPRFRFFVWLSVCPVWPRLCTEGLKWSTIEKSLVCVCVLFSSSCLMSSLSQMHYLKCRVYNVTKVSQRQQLVYWSLTLVYFLGPSGQIIRQWSVSYFFPSSFFKLLSTFWWMQSPKHTCVSFHWSHLIRTVL